MAQGRVRGTQYVVTLLEPCAEGTHETIAMEFDLASPLSLPQTMPLLSLIRLRKC